MGVPLAHSDAAHRFSPTKVMITRLAHLRACCGAHAVHNDAVELWCSAHGFWKHIADCSQHLGPCLNWHSRRTAFPPARVNQWVEALWPQVLIPANYFRTNVKDCLWPLIYRILNLLPWGGLGEVEAKLFLIFLLLIIFITILLYSNI